MNTIEVASAQPSSQSFLQGSSKPSAEVEAEMKSLRQQVAQLQEQLKSTQGELSALKVEKPKSLATSSLLSASSFDEGESEEAVEALIKLREEVIAAMTDLRAQGLAAARAMQSARAYRNEIESLKNELKGKKAEEDANDENNNSPRNISRSALSSSPKATSSSSPKQPNIPSSGNPFA